MHRRLFLSLWLPAPGRFTDELWTSIAPIYAKTLQHPFLRGLVSGSLPRSKFQFYLIQDALYLGAFSEALLTLAAKAPSPEWKNAFRRDATEAIATEKEMHEKILSGYGITAKQMAEAQMAPVNYAYTNHLMVACDRGSFAEGLAAMLPCYWIYWEVGRALKKQGSRNKDYQRWIAQYSSEEYGAPVRRVVNVMDQSITSETQSKAKSLFALSARYEYLFWDMAWREEHWLP